MYKLKYDQKYSDEFKKLILENDKSMKQLDRQKFWTSRNLLNQKLGSFTEELDRKVLSYAKGLLLGSFTEVDIDRLIDRIKKDQRISSLNQDQRSLLRMILIGLEHLSDSEVKEALKTEFNDIDGLYNYIVEYRPSLMDLPRKNVCLLIDKVRNNFLKSLTGNIYELFLKSTFIKFLGRVYHQLKNRQLAECHQFTFYYLISRRIHFRLTKITLITLLILVVISHTPNKNFNHFLNVKKIGKV